MCGIAGIFGPNGDDSALAQSMASMLKHRGPDGIQSWSEPCQHGGVGLGHTRLSIVDVAGSTQPLHSDDGCVLVMNGEIYNHQQIRNEERGFAFRTQGDGESILAAYAAGRMMYLGFNAWMEYGRSHFGILFARSSSCVAIVWA
ncbi:MAG: hypothetical protein Ct9H90mP16_13470 [Candidatus Poseidoniales archaeon]|nr:MAG: hypothetical protein Ct9H90mP16_13470 [Candidatus Poseidoniales archaeon]